MKSTNDQSVLDFVKEFVFDGNSPSDIISVVRMHSGDVFPKEFARGKVDDVIIVEGRTEVFIIPIGSGNACYIYDNNEFPVMALAVGTKSKEILLLKQPKHAVEFTKLSTTFFLFNLFTLPLETLRFIKRHLFKRNFE